MKDNFFRLENTDCLEGLKKLDSDSVDLIVTSPPYDNIRTYNGFSFDFENIAKEIVRILVGGGVIVWIIADQTINGSESGTSFRQALYFKELGLNLHDTMIWQKDSCAFPDSTRYQQIFEYMFVLSKGKPKTINLIADRKNAWSNVKVHGTFREADGSLKGPSAQWKESVVKEYGYRFNVWNIPTEKNNKTGHPAVFPASIAKDHILTWSKAGDTVCDPFSGSGTTAIQALNLNRNFIGFEISKEYYDKSLKRIEEETAQMSIFDFL